MKKSYLSPESVRQALDFLKARQNHTVTVKKKDWAAEYENCLRVIEELTTIKR